MKPLTGKLIYLRVPGAEPRQAMMPNTSTPALGAPGTTLPMPREDVSGPRKYIGDVSDNYDAKREGSEKWKGEQRIIEGWLEDLLRPGDWVLDAPIGTGRFIPKYEELDVRWKGVDISEDQLDKAYKKAGSRPARLSQGDITDPEFMSGFADNSVDVSVMVRMTRWLEPHEVRLAIKELKRITRKAIIVTTRDQRGHPYDRPVSLLEDPDNTDDGWEIDLNVAGYEEAYRIVRLSRVDVSGAESSEGGSH